MQWPVSYTHLDVYKRQILPVVITVYKDKSFEFVVKTAPAAIQLMEAAKIKSGSKEPNRSKVANVSWDQVKLIAQDKLPDLNALTIDAAMSMVCLLYTSRCV